MTACNPGREQHESSGSDRTEFSLLCQSDSYRQMRTGTIPPTARHLLSTWCFLYSQHTATTRNNSSRHAVTTKSPTRRRKKKPALSNSAFQMQQRDPSKVFEVTPATKQERIIKCCHVCCANWTNLLHGAPKHGVTPRQAGSGHSRLPAPLRLAPD